MNADQRRACDGLMPEEGSIMADMQWLREHCERLAWESTGRELKDATAKLRLRERRAE